MTLQEFLERLREDFLDDRIQPYYWSDDTLLRYAIDAEREACRRSNILITNLEDAMCNISITAGTSSYSLHPKILYILAAYNTTDNYPLYQVERVALDSEIPNWRTLESDTPSWFFIETPDIITIVPTPTHDFVLNLTVSHLPLNDEKQVSDSFEIPEQYQDDLLYWAAYLALSKEDINTDRKAKAQYFLQQFEAAFGRRKPALTEINRMRVPRLVSMRPMAKRFGFP